MDLNSLDISTASVLQGSAAKSINIVAASFPTAAVGDWKSSSSSPW